MTFLTILVMFTCYKCALSFEELTRNHKGIVTLNNCFVNAKCDLGLVV